MRTLHGAFSLHPNDRPGGRNGDTGDAVAGRDPLRLNHESRHDLGRHLGQEDRLAELGGPLEGDEDGSTDREGQWTRPCV
ncbi:hypothetical protein [Streptomyces cyaneofuscatus]|uniref:hypothetical protein n=1 Tax=Streptomyces cyaneofuscatus TaxID=66883 RepID=UPI00380FBF0A